MRFVLANRTMRHAGGTEVHLLTLGEQLQRLGHEVALYTPELGPYAEHVRTRGLPVHDSLQALPQACGVVLAQDTIVAYELRARYPDSLHVFRICGDVHNWQEPPQLPGALDAIVVLAERYARLARAGALEVPIIRLRVPIAVDPLRHLPAIGETPRLAVLLGNYAQRERLIAQAWEPHGVRVKRIGGGQQRFELGDALADADIVVAKSRAALDAMGLGKAVYVLDIFGGDGWVTPELYPALEADHFAGQATARVIDLAALERDLEAYRPGMGSVNRDLVLQHHDARRHAIEFVSAVRELRQRREQQPATEGPPVPAQELSRLTAMHWQWERHAREAWAEVDHVHAAMHQKHLETERAHEQVRALVRERDQLHAQLERVRATRAWRAATRLYRLKRALRWN